MSLWMRSTKWQITSPASWAKLQRFTQYLDTIGRFDRTIRRSILFTTQSLITSFQQAGVFAGQVVIVHTSMKAFGSYIVGSEQAVVDALMAVITPAGTLIMPTHSSDNTDPATWRKPPVPPDQWETIRQHMPPYRPESTPTNRMGRINECFRSYPGVQRSAHPAFSFAAWGQHAEFVIANC